MYYNTFSYIYCTYIHTYIYIICACICAISRFLYKHRCTGIHTCTQPHSLAAFPSLGFCNLISVWFALKSSKCKHCECICVCMHVCRMLTHLYTQRISVFAQLDFNSFRSGLFAVIWLLAALKILKFALIYVCIGEWLMMKIVA